VTRRQLWWSAAALLGALLLLALAALQFVGQRPETPAELSHPTSGGDDKPFAEAGPARAAFITSSMSSCTKGMAAQGALRERLSDEQIDAYCRCYSNSMADAVTTDEVKQIMGGAPPLGVVRDKAQSVARSCIAQLPSK
jgi:hypothetical protein